MPELPPIAECLTKAATQKKKCSSLHFAILYISNYVCPLQPHCSPEGDSGGLVCRCTEE